MFVGLAVKVLEMGNSWEALITNMYKNVGQRIDRNFNFSLNFIHYE